MIMKTHRDDGRRRRAPMVVNDNADPFAALRSPATAICCSKTISRPRRFYGRTVFFFLPNDLLPHSLHPGFVPRLSRSHISRRRSLSPIYPCADSFLKRSGYSGSVFAVTKYYTKSLHWLSHGTHPDRHTIKPLHTCMYSVCTRNR